MQNRHIARVATSSVDSGKKALIDTKNSVNEGFTGVIHEMGDRLSEVQDKLSKLAKREIEQLNDVSDEVSKRGTRYYRSAIRTVKARPVAAVTVAMVTGAAIGSAVLAGIWRRQNQTES